jgi:hypothetical protein
MVYSFLFSHLFDRFDCFTSLRYQNLHFPFIQLVFYSFLRSQSFLLARLYISLFYDNCFIDQHYYYNLFLQLYISVLQTNILFVGNCFICFFHAFSNYSPQPSFCYAWLGWTWFSVFLLDCLLSKPVLYHFRNFYSSYKSSR